ncbi:MAG: hypothetical protein HY782_16970 [Chloroflexi bacterium]|nr:hypothetical protein [Chloroflexota bacterium]
MTRRVVDLNGSDWRFGSVAQKTFGDVDDIGEVREWLPAQVPGDVRLDLLRAGKIADPFVAANNDESQWIDARDWWYTRELKLELQPDERAFLIFEGIDYQSTVFANGTQLGRHVGMFSRQVYELPTPNLQRPTSNVQLPTSNFQLPISVRVWGADALPKMRLSLAQRVWGRFIAPLIKPNPPFPDRYATLKCQMQFGWDFAPRLRTCGIWDDAYVVVTRSVFFEDVRVKSQVAGHKSQVARIQLHLALDSAVEQTVLAVINIRGKNFESEAQTFRFHLDLARGKQTQQVAFDLQDARLWNPWDHGEPNLYEIEIQLSPPSSQEFLDSFSTSFGIRSFELVRSEPSRGSEGSGGGVAPSGDTPLRFVTDYKRRRVESWTFVVNGQREFIRGANWVPLDAIPARLTRDDYAARLKQARDANVNFLRVWGGGLKEKRAFYDLCDELGILVWQEFPFAGAILDRFPRDLAFLKLARAESTAIVRDLRNHPSLVVWCGGNEFNTRGNRAIVNVLRAVVESEDGTRPFKPASPYRDESHNWRVWHRGANMSDYRQDHTPFLSEFGLQSAPDVESLQRFLPEDKLFPPNEMWEYHHAQLGKLKRYARSVGQVGQDGSAPTGAALSFVAATQRAQAFGLQIAIEHMRRRKGETSGVAVWQFNDAWPAISWSVVDYYGQPKRAYTELRRLYSPVFVSFDYTFKRRRAGQTVHGDLWLINDLCRAFDDVELAAYLNEQQICVRRVSLAPDSAARLDALDMRLVEGENTLRLELRERERVLSDHTYDLNFCDAGKINPLIAMLYPIYDRLMR